MRWQDRALCRGRPPEWWDTADDGARLALAICSVCPVAGWCATDQESGVVRAGVAWTAAGDRAALCSCGYPAPGARRAKCSRCDPPAPADWRPAVDRVYLPRGALDQRRDEIAALLAKGHSYRGIAAAMGVPPSSVRNVAKRFELQRRQGAAA